MLTVGVYGATGQVGGVMRSVLEARHFPHDRLRLFASSRSAGRHLDGVVGRGRGHRRPPRRRRGPVLHGRRRLPGIRGKGGRRGRHRHRQLLGVAHGPRLPARGARSQRRQPWIASRRGSSPIPTARPWCACRCWPRCTPRPGWCGWSASTYQAVSGAGLAGTAELDDRCGPSPTRPPPWPSTERLWSSRRRRCSRGRSPSTSFPTPAASTATRPTRSTSSATRAARSSASPTWRCR